MDHSLSFSPNFQFFFSLLYDNFKLLKLNENQCEGIKNRGRKREADPREKRGTEIL